MKNKFLKTIITISAVLCCGFMFSSFSPSLDGRAIVVEEGVFPQGLFAKTVGYLPGDIISVTNISGEKTVDILVIGALDPSEGVAIMLSPEAAKAIGIDKTNSNIVKITKRSGQDERVYGSAVIARQMNDFATEEDLSEDNSPSIPYISYEDDYADDSSNVNVIPPADTVQVAVSPEKTLNDSYVSVNPSDTTVFNQASTYPLLTSAEISAIKGGVSDIDRKSLKDKISPETEQNTEQAQAKKEDEVYSAMNLSKEIMDIPNAKSSKVDTADNINLDEVSVDNVKNNKGYDAPQGISSTDPIIGANDNRIPVTNQNQNQNQNSVYSEPLYEDKAEPVVEEPLPEELVLLDDLDSVSKIGPDSYDEQEAVIGSYGISRKANNIEELEVPPPFDEGEAQKRVYTAPVETVDMYTANQPKTEIPSEIPFEEEEILPDNNEVLVPENKETTEPENNIEDSDLTQENADSGADENAEIEQEITESIDEIEEPLLEEKVELDSLESIEEDKEVVEDVSAENQFEEEAVNEELPEIQDNSEDNEENAESESEQETENEETDSEIEEEILLEDELPKDTYNEAEPDFEIETEEPADETVEEDEYSAELPDFEELEKVAESNSEDKSEQAAEPVEGENELNEIDSEEIVTDDVDNNEFEVVDLEEPDVEDGEISDSSEEEIAIDLEGDEDEIADSDETEDEYDVKLESDNSEVASEEDSSLYGNLKEINEDFKDSLFFVEDELAKTDEAEPVEPVYSKELISDAVTVSDKDFVDEKLPSKDEIKEKELVIPEEVVEDFEDEDKFKEEEIPEIVKDSEGELVDDADYEEFSAITLVPAEDNPPVVEETVKPADENKDLLNEVAKDTGIEKNEHKIQPVPVVEKIEADDLDEIASTKTTEKNTDSSKTVDSTGAATGKDKSIFESSSTITGGKKTTDAKTTETKSAETRVTEKKASSYEKFVTSADKLASGKYYIQIATLSKDENVLEIVNKYSGNYPLAVIKFSNGSKQILVGPLSVDEYATVLERFKSYGYKDAFLKKIK